MKDYLNLFYGMIEKIDNWENLNFNSKKSIMLNFIDNDADMDHLIAYFDKYKQNLLNNTLNYQIKGVTNH